MAAMDVSKKNNDCYFFYYSTCLKGDSCMFRHEPSALGCETMCSFWQQGQCLNQHCNFRHMELRKNRKQIPCYWETQPSGCRKPHCSFLHKLPREPINATNHEKNTDSVTDHRLLNNTDVDSNIGLRRVSQGSETSYGSPPVDPLVVNFEEESDNESVPTSTPTKPTLIKTLEQIRLERIQAEQAALYGYENLPDLREWLNRPVHRIVESVSVKTPSAENVVIKTASVENVIKTASVENVGVKTLNEIRAEKKKRSHSPIMFDTCPQKQAKLNAQISNNELADENQFFVSSQNNDEENKKPVISSKPVKLRRTQVDLCENPGLTRFRKRAVKVSDSDTAVNITCANNKKILDHEVPKESYTNSQLPKVDNIKNNLLSHNETATNIKNHKEEESTKRRSTLEDEEALLLDVNIEDTDKIDDLDSFLDESYI